MKILFLSQFFTPEPFFKALPFARGLANRGHSVEVLTGFPNYPGGHVYDGYKIRPWQKEVMDGIPVTRVALYPSHDRSSIGRALNYVSFSLSASILGPLLTSKPDVVYVYHPPATVGLAACVLKLLKRTPFVYDVMDLWPDTIAATGMLGNPLLLSALHRSCSNIYSKADHVTVLSHGFRRALIDRGVPEKKVSVIYNWCDEDAISPTGRDEALAANLGLAGRFNIMFAGTMGLAQALDPVLDAAALCAQVDPSVQFVFMGAGVERARLEAKAAGSPNVLFLPPQPMSQMSRYLALADVLLVHLKEDPLFRITIPSKTQAFLAAAKPVLMAANGDAADVVKRAGAGLTIEPQDPRKLAAAVLEMSRMSPERLRAMGTAGRTYYLHEMSMSTGIARFEEIFRTVSGLTNDACPPPPEAEHDNSAATPISSAILTK